MKRSATSGRLPCTGHVSVTLLVLSVVFILALAGLAALVAPAKGAGLAAPPPRSYSLTIIHSNDFHGFDPMALARRATLIKRIRSEVKNVLVLDGGDLFNRGKYHKVFWGSMEMAALNAMGYDAWTLGNGEFGCDVDAASTLKHITDLAAQAGFPTLCANVVQADKNYLVGVKPYVVKEVGGLRIGIFGVTNSNKVRTYPQTKGLLVSDAVSTAAWLVPQVAAKSDIVIGLSHAGLSLDEATAAKVGGIAAIIGADDHLVLDPPRLSSGVPIAQAGGEFWQYLGRLDLTFEFKAEKWTLVKYTGRIYSIDRTIPADPAIQTIVDSFLARAVPAA